MKLRVMDQKKYFSLASKKNKKNYLIISTLKIGISLIVAILSAIFGDGSAHSIVVTALAATVSFLDGVILLYSFKENWIDYRTTSEKIKKEECFFYTKSEKYYNLSNEDCFNVFVQSIENIIQNSNNKWKETQTDKTT